MDTKLIINEQILLDAQSGELKSLNRDHVVRLEPLLLELLLVLARQPNRVVSRAQIIEAVWQGDERVGNPALTKAISKLRHLFIQSFNAPDLIETLPKKGYRFLADVRQQAPAYQTVVKNKAASSNNNFIRNIILGTLMFFTLLMILKIISGTSLHHLWHGMMH